MLYVLIVVEERSKVQIFFYIWYMPDGGQAPVAMLQVKTWSVRQVETWSLTSQPEAWRMFQPGD